MKKSVERVDLLAETLAVELIENKVTEDVYFDRVGSFKRNYSRDIESIEKLAIKNGIKFTINREGIYDYLPEEIFHFDTFTTSQKNKEKESNRSKHQKIKNQENQARLFFTPIENEFDALLINLEIEERKLFNSSVLNPFLLKFYETELKSKILEKEEKKKLTQLFPYLYKFKNNSSFFKFALEFVLNLNVQVEIHQGFSKFEFKSPSRVGKMSLGIDSICGDEVTTEVTQLQITVFLEDFKQVDNCLSNGYFYKTISYLKEIFMDATFELIVFYNFETKNKFMLNSDNNMRLGLNTFI